MEDLNEEINAKFNLNLTRDNRLDPTDEEACRYWNARKNEFLEKTAERKYVPEYYKIQSMIPQSTRELIQSYNADIDRILSNPKYTKDGRV